MKRNQKKLHNRLLELFIEYGEANDKIKGLRHHATVETSHGRQERRHYYTIAAPDERLFAEWKGVRSIGMVYRHREQGVIEHDETSFFISSLPPKVRQLSRFVRGHWAIENSQHDMLDVTFTEDASRIRTGNSPEISSAFRRMSLNILRQDTTVKDSIRGKRLRAGLDEQVLDDIYAAFQQP